MADPARLAINQATNRLQWDLRAAIEGYARCGITGIGVWRDRLEECGVAEANKMLGDHGMTVVGLCRAGDFPIDQAAAIGARCLVLVAGGLPPSSKDLAGARAQVRDGIAELLPDARAAGVPLALEPLHPMYAADRACTEIARAGHAANAGDGRILAFHISDWLVPTRDLLLDRGMMGDGVIEASSIGRRNTLA